MRTTSQTKVSGLVLIKKGRNPLQSVATVIGRFPLKSCSGPLGFHPSLEPSGLALRFPFNGRVSITFPEGGWAPGRDPLFSPPPAADHHTPGCTCVRPRRLRSGGGGGGTAAHRQERPPHPDRHRLTSPQLLCVCEKEQGPHQARSTGAAIKAASGGAPSTFTPLPHPPGAAEERINVPPLAFYPRPV